MQFPSLRTTNNASSLLYLNLKNNRITNITINQVEPLHLLHYLEISGNLLVEIDFIRYIPKLRTVYLVQNPFPPTKVLSVQTRALERLSLKETMLENFPAIYYQRSFLRQIDLNWNKISCIDIVHLANMTRLQKLIIGYNRIHGFPDNGCARDNISMYATRDWWFPSLKTLFLRYNRLTEFPFLPYAGSSSREITLDISRNQMTNVSENRLELLKNGTDVTLILSKNKITDMPYLCVVGPALVHAYLEENKIAYLSHEQLIGLINLKTLCLSGNRIGSFDFSVVPKLISLSKICFDDNSFSTAPIIKKEFVITWLTVTLKNNPIFCDEQICSLAAVATTILQIICTAPEYHIGRHLAAYHILICRKYAVHNITSDRVHVHMVNHIFAYHNDCRWISALIHTSIFSIHDSLIYCILSTKNVVWRVGERMSSLGPVSI